MVLSVDTRSFDEWGTARAHNVEDSAEMRV